MLTPAGIESYVAANRDRWLEGYKELVRIPSLSADPARDGELRRAAGLLARHCAAIGLANVRQLEEGGKPTVYAEWLGAPGKPTVLVYAHYDVQPEDPVALWHSPPFEPTERNGRIYARGASDDKATLWIALCAIEAWLKVEGGLPCNMKLFLEGEEETGSPSLAAILMRHKDLLGADFILSADGAMMQDGRPDVMVATRGIAKLEVALKTAAKDLHSGGFGGAVANPISVLSRLVASLHDMNGAVAVAGFYDGVREPTAGQEAELAAVPFDEAKFFAAVGARPGAYEQSRSVLERLWLRPTLEVNGIWGGWTGPGNKTVLPAEANMKITTRLVPGQDPDRVVEAIKAHLQAACPAYATLEFKAMGGGSPAYEVPPAHPALKILDRVLGSVYGTPTVRVRLGGTLPLCALMKQHLGIDTVAMSFSTGDEDYHAPNEFFRLSSFDRGLKAWCGVFPAIADAGADAFAGYRP
ncbi:MAG: dipeptidase [Acetobacteraceae bacterium]|nr:dipeptidase [Acetobacteraceae bacterium]